MPRNLPGGNLAAINNSITDSDMSDQQIKIRVWDLPVRIFHWGLVGFVATGLITGFFSPEWWMGIHVWAGYGTVLLVVFRLVWGVFGSEFSRFETFSFTPAEIIAHIRELIFLRPHHFIGHNPAGAMMIFALVFILSAITLSGLLVLGGEENQGPLAGAINYWVGDFAGEVHLVLTIILMVLISLHIMGVFIETRLTRENLIKSMVDGYKIIPHGKSAPERRLSRPLAAAACLLAFASLAGSVLWAFSIMPPSGITQLAINEDYTTECGDCHEAYHPSLLPRASWAMLMVNLEDHFGEDASLDQDITAGIASHLDSYAAEAWDTEASNRFSILSPELLLPAPYQISATPYWQRKHEDISAEVFKRKSIANKSNCASCHRDAATGHFHDQAINIPEK